METAHEQPSATAERRLIASFVDDSSDAIARDVLAVGRISAVPPLLRLLCQHTGMGFAAVARVSENSWVACAVQDNIDFGLPPGGQLDVRTTLCREVRAAREPIAIDQASIDPTYRDHHTPRIYGIESYVSVPIVLSDGHYFGNLCAIDPRPAHVSDPGTLAMFTAYAALIAVQLDIERKLDQATTDLRDARAAAQLQEEFVAVLGHDLRTPLSAVANIAEAMVLRQNDARSVEQGRRIRAATRRMSALINDVLDLARGRLGGGIELHAAPVDDLEQALRDVVAELRQAHPKRLLRDDDIVIREPVWCERGRVQQLLSNLLSNALTHGASGEAVDVAAAVEGDCCVLSVSNRGNPIAAENLANIFEPYWRSPASAQAGGLGLGLHICSQIVKAHGGAISVTSSVEDGTQFMARLPLRPR